VIQRVVFVKLKPQYRGAEQRALIAAHTREVLGSVAMVHELRVALGADQRTQDECDLAILLQLDDLDAVAIWRTERTHRQYVDVYLRPLVESIRVWNFELPEPSTEDSEEY
jgi:hypothetical protein